MNPHFYNTLANKKEEFKPLKNGEVKMYNCGPTMYGRQHIGNLSMYIFTDTIRRMLEYKNFKVKQVINITDFGHLSGDNQGDADIGEDRMTLGLKREKMDLTIQNMRVLAQKYADIFFNDLQKLNIDTKKITFPFASDYVKEEIKLIEKLVEKNFAYIGKNGVYFDTSKFSNYGCLGQINIQGLKEGIRVEMGEKRNHTDFILWKGDKKLGWQSPWGLGFPGWHIECSAMILKILGEQIDIHTGGIEHIGVHHNNEIAQSESATGKSPFVGYWLHRAHIKIDGKKIGKSEGNTIFLEDLIKRSIHPISFRFWSFYSHYRKPANFTWQSVLGAQKTLEKIIYNYSDMPEKDSSDTRILKDFENQIMDDLNTPIAISIFQEAKSKNAINKMDKFFNFQIKDLSKKIHTDFNENILEIKTERDLARRKKEWQKSDELRKEIEKEGFVLEDKDDKSILRKTLASLTKTRV